MVPEFEKDNVCFVVVFCISVYHPFFSSFFLKNSYGHIWCALQFLLMLTRIESSGFSFFFLSVRKKFTMRQYAKWIPKQTAISTAIKSFAASHLLLWQLSLSRLEARNSTATGWNWDSCRWWWSDCNFLIKLEFLSACEWVRMVQLWFIYFLTPLQIQITMPLFSLYLSPQGSYMVSQSNLSRPASNRCKLTLFIYKRSQFRAQGKTYRVA